MSALCVCGDQCLRSANQENLWWSLLAILTSLLSRCLPACEPWVSTSLVPSSSVIYLFASWFVLRCPLLTVGHCIVFLSNSGGAEDQFFVKISLSCWFSIRDAFH